MKSLRLINMKEKMYYIILYYVQYIDVLHYFVI